MFPLMKQEIDWARLKRPDDVAYYRVFDTIRERGCGHFLHGVAVEEFEGRLAVCFAFNEGDENSVTERLMVCWSPDGGHSWTRPERIGVPASHADSHSVFLVRGGELWCFGPRFYGLGAPPLTAKGRQAIHFRDLRMQAWRYAQGEWQEMGVVGGDFWPLGRPELMEDGNYLIPGCDEYWMGAVAVSQGQDLTRWEIVKLDTGGEVFTEAGAWIQGRKVLAVLRNQSVPTQGRYHAAVALSEDFGRSFSQCQLSNLPMATTKPFCGRLSDGRPYLVFNQSVEGAPHDRSRMILGVGEPGEMAIRRAWLLDEGAEYQGRRLGLSYPYARQAGGTLYVAYSYESEPGKGNHNDAMLAALDVSAI